MELDAPKLTTKRNLLIGGVAIIIFALVLLFVFFIKETPTTPELFEPVYDFVSLDNRAYSLLYPGWWQKTELKDGIAVGNELGSARVVILTSPVDSANSFGAIKESLLRDPSLANVTFKILPGNSPSYSVTGTRVLDGSSMLFTEYGFDADGFRYQIRAEDESGGKYAEILGDIVASFHLASFDSTQGENAQSNIDEGQARLTVENQAEVAQYAADLLRQGSKAEIEVEDLGDDWNVHVFEIVKNDDGSSHTATFGWYRVNKTTGKVTKDI